MPLCSLTHSGAVGRRLYCVTVLWLEWGSLPSGNPPAGPLVQCCLGLGCWSHSEVPINKCPWLQTQLCPARSLSVTEVVLWSHSFLLIPLLGQYLMGAECYLCQLIIYSKQGAKQGGGHTAPSVCPTVAVAMGLTPHAGCRTWSAGPLTE